MPEAEAPTDAPPDNPPASQPSPAAPRPRADRPDPDSDLQEVYVRAVAAIPELGQDEEGWLPRTDRVAALLDRGMLVEAEAPPR